MERVARARLWASRSFDWHALVPWFALAGVWLLFELPGGVRSSAYRLTSIRPSGDFLALVTLYQVGLALGYARGARIITWAAALTLVLFRLDRAIFGAIMTEEPLLYDQLYVLRHTFILISDLWGWRTFGVVTGLVVTVGGVVWLSRYWLRKAAPLFAPDRIRSTARTGYVIWLIVLALSVTDAVGLTKRPFVQWVAPALADNIDESRSVYKAVRTGLTASPYAYLERLKLERKPNVKLFIVESYGRLMFAHKDVGDAHRAFMTAFDKRLQASGYQSVSAYTRAPVRGGRSWLADGSLLTGIEIRHEAVYTQIMAALQSIPHLTRFLARQGYRTVSLAPSDRDRPGIRVVNFYGYDQQIHMNDLNYRGPIVGWGIVPDQYSLAYTRDHFLAKIQQPLFFSFHMVSSHAPWRDVPQLVGDYRELSTGSTPPVPVAVKTPEAAVLARLRAYDRNARAGNYRKLEPLTLRSYAASIRYELELIADDAAQDRGDTLYVVVGDHQPPLLGTDASGYDTPMVGSSRVDLQACKLEYSIVSPK